MMGHVDKLPPILRNAIEANLWVNFMIVIAIMVQAAASMFKFDASSLPRHHEALWLPEKMVGHSLQNTNQDWEFWLKLPYLD